MTCDPSQFPQNFQQPGDPRLLAAVGSIPGTILKRIHGFNPNVGTTPEHTWFPGGIYPWPITTETLDLVSTDVNDTLAGTGARTVTIIGLDSSMTEVSETVDMTGIVIATTTQTFFRVNDMIVSSVGTYGGSNLGTITATNTGSAQLLAYMDIGTSLAAHAHYTVPVNKRAITVQLNITPEGNKAIDVNGFIRTDADIVAAPFGPQLESITLKTLLEPMLITNVVGTLVPEKTDFWVESTSTSGNVGQNITASILVFD